MSISSPAHFSSPRDAFPGVPKCHHWPRDANNRPEPPGKPGPRPSRGLSKPCGSLPNGSLPNRTARIRTFLGKSPRSNVHNQVPSGMSCTRYSRGTSGLKKVFPEETGIHRKSPPLDVFPTHRLLPRVRLTGTPQSQKRPAKIIDRREVVLEFGIQTKTRFWAWSWKRV